MTKSYDSSSHFETASDDVLELYQRITGEKLDLNIEPTEEEEYWWPHITHFKFQFHIIPINQSLFSLSFYLFFK